MGSAYVIDYGRFGKPDNREELGCDFTPKSGVKARQKIQNGLVFCQLPQVLP